MTNKDVRTDVDLKGTGQDQDPDHLVRIHIVIVSILLYASVKMERVQKNKHVNLWLFQKDVTIVAKLDISDGIVEKGGGGPDKDQ